MTKLYLVGSDFIFFVFQLLWRSMKLADLIFFSIDYFAASASAEVFRFIFPNIHGTWIEFRLFLLIIGLSMPTPVYYLCLFRRLCPAKMFGIRLVDFFAANFNVIAWGTFYFYNLFLFLVWTIIAGHQWKWCESEWLQREGSTDCECRLSMVT